MKPFVLAIAIAATLLAQAPPKFEIVRTLTGHKRFVVGLAFSKDGRQLASASWDGTAKLWDVASGRAIRTLHGNNMAVTSVAISPDDRLVAAGSDDTTISVWDAASGHLLHRLDSDGSYVTSVAFSSDGRLLAASTSHARILIYDLARGEHLRTLTGHVMAIHSVTFFPTGHRLVSASRDQTVRIWNADTGKQEQSFSSPDRFVAYSVAVSPDAARIAAGASGGALKFCQLSSGQCSKPTSMGNNQPFVFPIAYLPDGKWVISGAGTGVIAIWDTATGKVAARLQQPSKAVESIAVSPDGKWLASGGDDDQIKLWKQP